MQAIVLSNQKQLTKFLAFGLNPCKCIIFCDNERFYDVLESQNLKFQKLDEFLLKDQWEEINAWGISESAEWITLGRDNHLYKKYDLPVVICLWFSVLLIMALKNYLYTLHVLSFGPVSVTVFKGSMDDQYPLLAGNTGLNYFLKDAALAAGIPVHYFDLDQSKDELLHEGIGIKQKIRALTKRSLEWLYSRFVRPRGKFDVFVFGTLRHLASTMIELKKRGASVFFYDDELRINHLAFALKNGISYFVPACFSMRGESDAPAALEQPASELSAALDHPACKNHFIYRGYDFKNYIRERIFGTMNRYAYQLQKEEKNYRKILGSCEVRGVLVDEDFNAHSFFVEFMKKAGVPIFCISHANLALDCAVKPENRPFDLSHTFVQSEHEKTTYLDRGWSDKEIVMTGIPRYDYSTRLLAQRGNFWKPQNSFRILHCTGFLFPASPDIPGYIGVDEFAYRYYQEQAVQAFIEAIRGLPATFVLKPHYAEDEESWRIYLKKNYPNDAVEVAPAARSYFELLLESDAMAIGLWTSTIIEAGIANLPVFYLDFENTDSKQIENLEHSGLCKIIRSQKELKQALQNLCAQRNMPVNRTQLTPPQEYYLGRLDAGATVRVTEFILQKIGRN